MVPDVVIDEPVVPIVPDCSENQLSFVTKLPETIDYNVSQDSQVQEIRISEIQMSLPDCKPTMNTKLEMREVSNNQGLGWLDIND